MILSFSVCWGNILSSMMCKLILFTNVYYIVPHFFHYERKFILNTNGNNIFADKKHALLIAVYLNSKNFVENSYFNEHES